MIFEWGRFPKQLRFWGLHGSINALPSFLIASVVLNLWEKPAAVGAMLLAVASFVLIYSFITSLSGPFGDDKSLLSRALKVGTKARLVISAISILMVLCGEDWVFYAPDFWAGYAAAVIVTSVWITSGDGLATVENGEFFPIYAITMVEGVILSACLLMISFFALLVLQIRQRRKRAKRWASPT